MKIKTISHNVRNMLSKYFIGFSVMLICSSMLIMICSDEGCYICICLCTYRALSGE